MPSNAKLIEDILEIKADAVVEGLSNGKLAELLGDLRKQPEPEGPKAEQPEPKPEEPKPEEPVGHTVAEGKTITSKRGILGEGDPITAEHLGGGVEALAALVESGHVVAPK